MPDYLVLDVRALLDRSQVGVTAAKALEDQWAKAQARVQAMKGQVSQRQVEDADKQSRAELEQTRAALRDKLLARATPIVKSLAEQRGAKLVLERGSIVLSLGDVVDITGEVIQAVDTQ